MSNAEVSAEYCQPAFVARNLAMSASCPDTKAYLLELEQLWLSPSSQARALELLCEDRMRQPQICDHCGGRFGMVTHRWWGNKSCKKTCKDAYLRELALGRDNLSLVRLPPRGTVSNFSPPPPNNPRARLRRLSFLHQLRKQRQESPPPSGPSAQHPLPAGPVLRGPL
jgi:hypothetical protein